MAGYHCSYGRGRIIAGQDDLLIIPSTGGHGLRAAVLLHGQLGAATDWNDPTLPGQQSIALAIVRAGICCASIYAEGPGWGNDQAVADMDSTRLFMGAQFGCKTDRLLLVGASMGAMDAFNYARTYPSRVAAIIGLIPASDMDDLRDNNRAGTARANINTAWGMPAGSTSATNPLPARANPTAAANAAAIASSGAAIRMYYSSVDTVVIPSTVTTLAQRVGIVPRVIDTVNGHSDATIGQAPLGELTQTLLRAA